MLVRPLQAKDVLWNRGLMQKRTQGRPPRGIDDGGRTKLLEGTRSLLRARPQTHLRRQEIARYSGVTPALVTYYFSETNDLLVEATRPVLQEAIEKLNRVIQSQESYRARLQTIVSLLIEFAAENTRILDVYVEAAIRSEDEDVPRLIIEAYTGLLRFFGEASRAGEWREFEPTFFLFALWGMCKFVAEPPMFPIKMFGDMDAEEVRRRQGDLIVDLLVRGISSPLTQTTVSGCTET